MTTGMTTAERWYEVARRVEGGSAFSAAVWSVFDQSPSVVVGLEWNLYAGDWGGDDHEYILVYSMLSEFLAYEAEDEASEVPEPVTMVAAEEPIAKGGLVELVEAQAEYNRRIAPVMVSIADFGAVTWTGNEERRSTWNAKLADGMRKWADWLEERF